MELSYNGFWAALYRDCRGLWNAFSHNAFVERSWRHTDLCTFVRTIFVWAPLAVLFNLIAVSGAVFSIGFFLLMLTDNISTVGVVVPIILGVVAIGAGIFFLTRSGAALAIAFSKSETVNLVKEYVRAKKSRICPMITFGGTNAHS